MTDQKAYDDNFLLPEYADDWCLHSSAVEQLRWQNPHQFIAERHAAIEPVTINIKIQIGYSRDRTGTDQ